MLVKGLEIIAIFCYHRLLEVKRMYPLYSKEEKDFELYRRKARHIGPHLHASLEIVTVTEGSLELGVGTVLYHMTEGDLAIIFPNQIHHYQVFDAAGGRMEYLIAAPSLAGNFLPLLQSKVPECPVIPAKKVHPDIRYAFQTLTGRRKKGTYDDLLRESYIQIILARALPLLTLSGQGAGTPTLVDQVVSYVAEHFTEEIALESMAKDLLINPFALSRVFSQAFHMNFNRYINLTRLEYSKYLLEETDKTITDICMESGFGSQRTFNRVFREEMHMTPAAFRKANVGG